MIYSLRMVLLAIHFLVSGVLGLMIGLCRPFHPDNTRLCARLYSIPARIILGYRLETDIASVLDQHGSFLIAANHQSNYDLFVTGAVMPRRTVTIGKRSLLWAPLFGQVYWLAGNVLINRSNAEQAKQAMLLTTDVLQNQNTSIWFFVEGTRNLGKGLLPFKSGAFHMAINAGVPIIPMCTSTYKKHLQFNKWHSGTVKIRSLPAITTTGLTLDDIPALVKQCRDQMLQCIAEMDLELENR
ncbi:MAG: 1-acylglycerol-3-phosphate O-acyltransferase [Rhodoferax sp.]|jgi:1-acyl-sn-glycerol-3-phosphate acyltransferase|nr:1-acylglycerol-3-phosphate O-acyltransferase [Rhodoferax sp.]